LEFISVTILSAAFCYLRQYGVIVHILFGTIASICTFSIYRYTKAVLNSSIIVSNVFTRWYGKKGRFQTTLQHAFIKTVAYALANFLGSIVGNFIAITYNNGLIYPPVMIPHPMFLSFVSQVAVCTIIPLVYNLVTEKGHLVKKPVMLDLEKNDGMYTGKRGRKLGPNHYYGVIIGATYSICGLMSHYKFGGVTDPMHAFVQNIFWGVYFWIPDSIGMGFLYLLASFVGGLLSGLLFLGFKIWWDFGGKGKNVHSKSKTCNKKRYDRSTQKKDINNSNIYSYEPIVF